MTQQPDDVWAQATHHHPTPHIATGAAACRYCPVCRAIAVARTSGPDIVEHLMDAGRSLHIALRETLSAFDRSASGTTPQRERAIPTPPAPRRERHGAGGNPGGSG
jgi:hypothetical protein